MISKCITISRFISNLNSAITQLIVEKKINIATGEVKE